MQPTVPFVRPEANLGLAHPYTVKLIDGEEREKVVPKRLHQRIQRYLMYLFKDLLQFGWERCPSKMCSLEKSCRTAGAST